MLHIIPAKRVFVKARPRNFTRVLHILHSWRKSGKAERGLHSAERCGKRKAGRDAHGTASSRHWVELPIHSRLAWMAAPQRFMVPVRAQNGTCAHDDSIRSPRVGSGPITISAMTNISDFNPPRGGRPARRHPLQIGNSCFNPRPITASTSFVPYVRKGGEKPGAISQPCLAAKPPFLPGVTPTVILACARPHCQRRPPCGGRRLVPLRPAAHGQQFRGAVFLVHIALVQHVQRSRQGGGP